MNKLYKIGPSQIHGNGLIATQDIEPNQMIGLSHRGGQVASELGQYVNHSDNPTAISMPSGNERYIISNQFIKAGGEITQNYRLQPELEQPEDFITKAQNGGQTEEYRPQTEQITVDTIVDPNIPLAPTQDEQLLVDYYQPVVDWFGDYLKSDYYKTLLDKELPGGNVYSRKTKKEATKRQLAYTENYQYTDPKFDPYGLGNQYLSIYNYMEPDRDSIYKGAFYRPGKKYINMYGWQYPGSFGGGKNIMAHELGHTDDGIISGPSWDNWIREHNKLVQSGEVEWKEEDQGDHSSRTEETRSDVIRLRYMLNEAGLFDTTGEYKEFTEEDYDKAFEKFGNLENTDSRIFKLYNKEDVIYLMNNMANLDTNPFEIVDDIGGYSNYMSKEGGSVHNPSKPKGRDGSVYLRDKNSVIKDPLNVTNDLSNTALYEGQSPSTHYMADDDNLTAWPTLFQDPEGNWYRGGREEAERLGEVYTFDTREQMIDFARKGNWKSKMQEGGSIPKAQLGKGLSNILTRMGKPSIAKKYGFDLPNLTGFTPPFTGPIPLVSGSQILPSEGLKANNRIWTKLATDRTHPRIQDYTFEDMTGEYDWLTQARLQSENIVKATNPIYDSTGKLFSYDMPDLTQKGYITLNEYTNRLYNKDSYDPILGENLITARNEYYKLIYELNSKGLFHLDLHNRNILVKPGFNKEILDWKIIDPVGLPMIHKDLNFQEFPPIGDLVKNLDIYDPSNPGMKNLIPLANKNQQGQFQNVMQYYGDIEKTRHKGLYDWLEPYHKTWPWHIKQNPPGMSDWDGYSKQLGGSLPKAQLGRAIKFPKNIFNKVAIDNRFLPTKKLNNILSKNFNQGQQLMLMQTLRQNPQLIQNNQIDLKTWQELTNLNLSKSTPFLTDITGIVKIPPGNTVGIQDPNLNIIKSKWTNLETGDDLGLYRYSNLLPSQFKKGTNIEKYRNTSGGTSYLYPLIKTGNLVNPLNYGFSMPGLFTNPYLPIHHDGLHLKESGKAILDPNAFGWLRGFVDERFPDTYMLKEAQTDLSKDNLYNTLLGVGNIKNTHGIDDLFSKTSMKLSELSARTDKKVNSLERQIQHSQSKLAQLKDIYNNYYGLEDWVNIPGYRGTIDDLEREISSLESLIQQYNTSLLTGPDGRYSSIMDPLQASRIFTDPYFSLHNEMLPLLRNKGFKNIGIPTPSTIKNIQGWTGPEQVLYSKQGVFGHYDKLAKNQNLLSLPNTYELDNYKANIYNILNNPYKPFKQEGGEVYKYERSPFKDGKFVISNPEDLIIEISKTEVFTPEFKMGGTTKMNEYTLEKKFDNDKKLPYIEYTGDPDLEGRVYYDDETNEIVDVTTLELKKKRRHNRIKVIIDKYEEGNQLTHTEKDVLNSLGLLD